MESPLPPIEKQYQVLEHEFSCFKQLYEISSILKGLNLVRYKWPSKWRFHCTTYRTSIWTKKYTKKLQISQNYIQNYARFTNTK